MATVDTLLVRIEADMSGLRRSLASVERQTEQTSQKMSRSLTVVGSAIKFIAGAVVVRQIARTGKGMLDLASNAAEMQSMSEAVFGDYIGDIRNFASETAKATQRSRFELEEMAATVQDTFVPLGFARGTAAEMSKSLVKLAVDVGSFKNAQDVGVMNAFTSALVGNHESVRRFGIVITETELQAELFRMGITKSKNEVSAAEKVQARFNLILAGTKDAQGDAERTANSFANQSKGLSAITKDLGVELGRTFITPATAIVGFLRDAAAGVRLFAQSLRLIDKKTLDEIEVVERVIESLTEKFKFQNERLVGLRKDIQMGTTANEFLNKEYDKQLKVVQKLIERIRVQKEELADLTQLQKNETEKQKESTEAIRRKEEATKKTTETTQVATEKESTFATQMFELSQQTNAARLQLAGYNEEQIRLIQESDNMEGVSLQQLERIKEETDARNRLTSQIEAQKEADQRLNGVLKEIQGPTAELQQKLTDINSLYENGAINQEQFEKATFDVNKALMAQSEVGRNVIEVVGKVSEGVAKGIADVVTGSAKGLASFRDTFRNILNSIIKKMIEAKIQALLMRAAMGIMSSIGGGLGGLFGGFSGPSIGSGTSLGLDSALATRATGGSARGGQSFLVGERGPEIFTAPTSGRIIPNNQANMAMSGGQNLRGGGGTNITQNFNVTTGVQQTVRAEILNMMPLIKQESVGAVIEARQRGGAIAVGLGA